MARESEQNQKRESFVFYASWWEAIKDLPRDIQGEVLTAIVEYGLNGVTTGSPKQITKAILTLVKPQIDANYQRFINGCNGGRKPNGNQDETETKPKPNQSDTESEPNVYVYDNDNVNVNDFFSAGEKKKAKKILFEKGLIGTSAQTEIERYASYNLAKGIKLKNKVAGLKLWDIQAKDRIPAPAVKTLTGFFKVAGDEFTDAFLDDVRRIYMDDEGINIVCSDNVEQWMESYNDNPSAAMIEWKRKKNYSIYFLR